VCVCAPRESGESAAAPKVGDDGVVCISCVYILRACVCVCVPEERRESVAALQRCSARNKREWSAMYGFMLCKCVCVCVPRESGESAAALKIGDGGVPYVCVCFACVCVCARPGRVERAQRCRA